MLYRFCGRHNGKTLFLLCERISELELQIELAKKLGLSYKSQEKEYNKLVKELDNKLFPYKNKKEEF